MPSENAAMPMRPRSRIRSVSMKPSPCVAEQVLGGNAAVLEHQLDGVGGAHAELVFLLAGAEPRRALLDDERRDAPLGLRLVGHRHDHGDVAGGAVGDELLGAVEHPVIAIAHRGRAGAAGVGSGAVLRQAPAADLLALGERDEEPLLLLLRAGQEDVPRAEAVVRGDRESDPGVDARELLDHDARSRASRGRRRRIPAARPRP